MGILFSIFGKKKERERVSGILPCTNALSNSFRGLLSFLLTIVIMALFARSKESKKKTVVAIWLTMYVFMLFVPMSIGACALIPVFCCPIFGLYPSDNTCKNLINENILLFFVGTYLLLIFNNCGIDRRLACFFLASGDKDSYTPRKLLLKSCMAAFVTSALCERGLATQVIMNYVVTALQPLQAIKGEADYVELKKVICNAIAISSSIGSMCIMHSSLTTLQMRSFFCEASGIMEEFPDVFNFLNYSAFAIPTALVMFILNIVYFLLLVNCTCESKPMTPWSQEILKKAFLKNQKDLGDMSNHEKVSTFFYIVIMFCYFFRWSKWLKMGWATFRQVAGSPDLCGVKDATTAAIFAILLHFLPKSLNFTKIFSANKRRDIPAMKVESGILFWKFVDKKTDYSLFFVFGSGIIIYKCVVGYGLIEDIAELCGDQITDMDWNVGILIVVLAAVSSATIMSGMAAQACLMPFALGMAMVGQNKWPQRQYLVALAVGLGTGLGFLFPFQYTTAFYVKSIGKVELKKQALYSVASTIICALILWLAICFFAPILWDPNDEGIVTQVRPIPGFVMKTTTAPPDNSSESTPPEL